MNIFIYLYTCFIIIEMGRCLQVVVLPNTTPESRSTEAKKLISDRDVISLNVGGHLFVTIRSTLTRIRPSILSMMFNGQWDEKLNRDEQGNIFLDFHPMLFEHLLEQLRLIEDGQSMEFSPPLSIALRIPFEKMLRKLGIYSSLLSSDVHSVNVGGNILTIRQKILEQFSNITDDFFLDSHPDQIRQRINHLRAEQSSTNETSSTENIDYHDGICPAATWDTNGITVAGGHGPGSGLNQLDHPMGLFIDEHSTIYIADTHNHRILKWSPGASQGEILLHDNATKNYVSKIVVHRNGTIYYCDRSKDEIIRWFNHHEDILLSNTCWGLALDRENSLYISGHEDPRILQYPSGDIVAGGHGVGNDINQLSSPYQIFVDHNQTIYIADYFNHRIMKWFKDSKEGLVVAGGHGYGSAFDQLKLPHAVLVDQMGTMYIVDFGNDRIIRWFKHSESGIVLIGNDGSGNRTTQLSDPYDLAFDRQGNLYVADTSNHRIQMYRIDKTACEISEENG